MSKPRFFFFIRLDSKEKINKPLRSKLAKDRKGSVKKVEVRERLIMNDE